MTLFYTCPDRGSYFCHNLFQMTSEIFFGETARLLLLWRNSLLRSVLSPRSNHMISCHGVHRCVTAEYRQPCPHLGTRESWGKESRQLQRLSVFTLKHPCSVLLPPWSPCRVTVVGLPVALDKGHTFCHGPRAHSPLCCHVSPSYLRGLGFEGAGGVSHKQPTPP